MSGLVGVTRISEGRAPRAARLDVVVCEVASGVSRSRAAALIRDGRVEVDGEVVTRPAARCGAGAVVTVREPPPTPDRAMPQDLPVRIVYQDEDIAVIDKEPGMVVHPSAGHGDGTLVNALLHHLDHLSGIGGVERPGIVHRLDRGTSGLMVVAKNDAAHASLAGQFADKSAGRLYLALCLGSPPADTGRIESRVARHPKDRLRWASTDGTWGKRAVTHWRVLGRSDAVCLVECRLKTGRTHQVRVHLSEQGWPIAGDSVYKRRGARVPPPLARLLADLEGRPLLHAWRLELDHPRGGRRSWDSALPADFAACVDAVGLGDAVPPLTS